MSAGYKVFPLMQMPRECVIDEQLIRDCIYLKPAPSTEDERIRVVGNREGVVLREKMQNEIDRMGLHGVETLMMSFRRVGRIENLTGLSSLTKLCLDNNHIQKMENLSHLVHLRWLDLSYNQIERIEGLETLVELENVSLYSNKVRVVEGLDTLSKLSTLSLGENAVESLDETTRYLHHCKALRVLTLKGCPVTQVPHFRSRLLTFVPALRFLDGCAVKASEHAAAREEQRENLVPIDEEDEKSSTAAKAAAEEAKARESYARLNCPNDAKFCDELFQIPADGHDMRAILKSDLLISASKETLDRFQNEFNEKAKELADTMRAIRERRDADDAAYLRAKTMYNAKQTSESRELIHQFEKKLKSVRRKGVGGPATPLDDQTISLVHKDLEALQSDLVEKEADQYDAFEALNRTTIGKWKNDAVDVVLQSAFESLFKLEGDFQVNLRQIFDSIFEQRRKREEASDDFYSSSRQDTFTVELLSNKEEYQKLLSEWFEQRRRRLEDLEMHHLKSEEHTLSTRTSTLLSEEHDRHRQRLNEITDYIQQTLAQLEG